MSFLPRVGFPRKQENPEGVTAAKAAVQKVKHHIAGFPLAQEEAWTAACAGSNI